MRLISVTLLLFLLLVLPARAQTVTVVCPTMFVLKQRIGLWQAQRITSVATVGLPTGEVIVFDSFTIQATYVRGVLCKAVDPCQSLGTSKDGSVLNLQLPREPVHGAVAQAMTARGTLTRPDGTVWTVVIVYPDCRATRVSRGVRLAAAVTATGTVVARSQ